MIKAGIPPTKFASQCLDEFDNFMVKQEDFNDYFGRQLKQNAYMIEHLSDYMSRVKGELKLISKHASMVTTQVEQVLKAQNDFLNELNSKNNDYDVRVATRTGKMTQEPLYPKGHPKRIEQDSQRNNVHAPSASKKKKKKMIGLCMLLVNLLLTHLRIQMKFLFLMLKHNLVMNMNLVIVLMMMFILMLNLGITMK